MKKLHPGAVVEFHHQVLPAWAELRKKSGKPPFLLTLDHHTDILRPRAEIPRGAENLESALKLLRHDEHIVWAYESGLISGALVVSQEDFTPSPFPEAVRVCFDSGTWPSPQEVLNSSDQARRAAECWFETCFLSRIPFHPDGPYILDIDLDCVLCEKALHPADCSCFERLAEQAALVTVSLERDWQRILRLKGETLDSDSILAEIAV